MRDPIRTCVGCHRRDAQSAMGRFVLRSGRLRVEATRRLPGRGAYLHHRDACVGTFARRGGFVRSLRAVVAKDQREALRAQFAEVQD